MNSNRNNLFSSSHNVLDIPSILRNLFIKLGLIGLMFIVIGSLSTGGPEFEQLDKMIHFSGYFALAFLCALGLRPLHLLPAFIFIAFMGFGLECLQTLVGRGFEIVDIIANLKGLSLGAVSGLIIRVLYYCGQTYLEVLAERRNTISFSKKEYIFEQGEQSSFICFVKTGRVRLVRKIRGQEIDLGVVNPGEVFGEVGVLSQIPRYASAVADQNSKVYFFDKEKLFGKAGRGAQPAVGVVRFLLRRLHETNQRLEEQMKLNMKVMTDG